MGIADEAHGAVVKFEDDFVAQMEAGSELAIDDEGGAATGAVLVGGIVVDAGHEQFDGAGAADDDGAEGERVGGDGRDGKGFDVGGHDGAAGSGVVGGGADGGGDDDTVAGNGGTGLAVDREADADHAEGGSGGDDGVIEAEVGDVVGVVLDFDVLAVGATDVDGDEGAVEEGERFGGFTEEGAGLLAEGGEVKLDEEAEFAEVHAQHGDVETYAAASLVDKGAVATEDDDEIGPVGIGDGVTGDGVELADDLAAGA